jgi:heme exporter protein D
MNWSEFFSMGGYAFYVWGSYLVTLIVMGGEVVLLLRRRNLLRAPKRDELRLEVRSNE